MMRGKNIFKVVKPILNFVALLISYLPRFLKYFMFDFLSIFSGKLFVGMRYVVLKSLCKKVGDNVYTGKYIVLKNLQNVEIGDNVSLHDFCYIDGMGGIEIGSNVSIAHNCTILTSNHTWSDLSVPIKYNKEILSGVKIDNDVWVGCDVRILAGVTIGSRSIIAAGAIVNKHVSANTLVGGVPAKLIKHI